MKPITFLAFLTVVLVTSCEKVIDVDLENTAKKYVIEGVVTNREGVSQVTITRTKNMNDNNELDGISGAQVSITDGKGLITPFNEEAPGIYRDKLSGVPGETYTLNVQVNGEHFTAVSTMPHPVSLDSLYISEMDMMHEKEKQANVVFKDPVGTSNAYRFVQYVNGKKDKHFFVQNDELSNGRMITASLFMHDSPIKTGDTVAVEMQCIDPAVYHYWFSLYKGATGESTSPANPVTNISGGALGYFSAHAVSTKMVITQ
jgi:hypothetical protein